MPCYEAGGCVAITIQDDKKWIVFPGTHNSTRESPQQFETAADSTFESVYRCIVSIVA